MFGKRTESIANKEEADAPPEEPKIKYNNDIKDIRTMRQLEKVMLDFDSPRLKQAMDDLGVSLKECQKKEKSYFEKKGLDPDVIDLRYKHYQGRLIDTINRIIEQRRIIKRDQMREAQRNQGSISITTPNVKDKLKSKTPANRDQPTGGMFLTAFDSGGAGTTHQSPNMAKRRPSNQQKPLDKSPSQLSFMQNQSNTFQGNLDELIQTERKRVMNSTNKTKEIMMLRYANEKQRIKAQKDLEKKQAHAAAVQKKANKAKQDKIQKHLEKSLTKIDKMQNEAKTTNREHMSLIKEFEEKEKNKFMIAERKREEKQAEQMKFLEIQKEKRLRALSNKSNTERAMTDEMQEFHQKLNSKMNSATNQYHEILNDKKREIQRENDIFKEKVTKYQSEMEESKRQDYIKYQESEKQKERRLRQTYNYMNKLFTDYKQTKREQFENMNMNKANKNADRDRAKEDLKEKMDRSAKAVADFKAGEAHKNMLQKELAKLKDDDMKKVHTRAKRLETRKKQNLIETEQKNFEKVRNMKDKESKLVDFRYQNKVKYNYERQNFGKSMDIWSKQGYVNQKIPRESVSLLTKIEERMGSAKGRALNNSINI